MTVRVTGARPSADSPTLHRDDALARDLARLGFGLSRERRQLQGAELDVEAVIDAFTAIGAGSSIPGGEQQMVALARALASEPKVVLADELSLGVIPVIVLGVIPVIVQRLLEPLRDADACGAAVLVVESHAHAVLDVADRGYVPR